MYAIIETGGKQYKVSEGDVIDVERLDSEQGEEVHFDRVLLISDEGDLEVGRPVVEGGAVRGRVLENGRGEKIVVFKYKPKINYRRKQGHRQPYSRIQIEAIERW